MAQVPGLDYPALLSRFVDVDWLARSPAAGERCVQWSSYDRASRKERSDPSAFYANNDRGQYLRTEERNGGKEYVMVETKGPGCIARIWSANPSGTLHFDIDGARVWSVDFAALCAGKVAGVPEPLAGMRARGGNCYLPIPFVKSLVLTATAADLYYAVDVLQLEAGQQLFSFAPQLLVDHRESVRALCAEFPSAKPPFATELHTPVRRKAIEPGQVVRRFRVELPAELQPDQRQGVLQASLLVVRCGQEETVRVPLGDFFGAGSGWRDHAGRFLAVQGQIGYCAFPMPMPAGGSIEIATESEYGDLAPELVRVEAGPLAEPKPLLFRASYHLVKGTPTRPFTDHLVLDAKGVGRFVGCALLVRNPSRIWWGEGDEKFTVDGEAFPSWFGTGTEDYFGYAWCDPTPFSAPFHAQIECQGPMNFGFTQLLRTHVLDNVPFQRSFRFELERWHWVEDIAMDYATVAYWYGAEGATSGLPTVPAVADRTLPRLPGPPVFVAANALEGEALRVVSCAGGTHEIQDMWFVEKQFSRDAQLWWRDGNVGDALVLAVPVPVAGRYRVVAALCQADDYGIVQISLGGQRLGAPFDGYAERVRAAGPREFGVVDLPAGEAELRCQLVGSNPKAKPRRMLGFDYLQLEKLP